MTATEAPHALTTRQVAWRLFFTAWIVYGLHFSTDVVREHYPALALGDHFSFQLDGYCGMHPDLFKTPGRGCHIGNNPGVSMFAAIPYALARPVIDPIVARVQARRLASGQTEPPPFNTEWANARRFYELAWQKGLDIKLGLAAWVMHAFFMAPVSALSVVLVFLTLRVLLARDRAAMWLALLYAFGTPVFFRTGFLNHNLMLGLMAFAGFMAVWNPWNGQRLKVRTRDFLCGASAGLALLFDYSGVVVIAALFGYVALKRWREGRLPEAARGAMAFVAGTLPGVLLLWFYQWKAFGHPFYPGQHWMPPVQWIELGYQGYQFPPDPGLFGMLLFDHRFGLFVAGPILLLALGLPWVNRRERAGVPWLEQLVLLGLPLAMTLFFAGNNYTRLQFNTGLRYLTPVIPFLFLAAALVLVRMRPLPAYAWALAAVIVTWPMAMYREVERPLGVLDPVARTMTGGFALPALNTLSQTGGQYGDFFSKGVTPLALFVVAGAMIYGLWSPRFRRGAA
jgi:hypothetical protein